MVEGRHYDKIKCAKLFPRVNEAHLFIRLDKNVHLSVQVSNLGPHLHNWFDAKRFQDSGRRFWGFMVKEFSIGRTFADRKLS
jgi:hypothetical protein